MQIFPPRQGHEVIPLHLPEPDLLKNNMYQQPAWLLVLIGILIGITVTLAILLLLNCLVF